MVDTYLLSLPSFRWVPIDAIHTSIFPGHLMRKDHVSETHLQAFKAVMTMSQQRRL